MTEIQISFASLASLVMWIVMLSVVVFLVAFYIKSRFDDLKAEIKGLRERETPTTFPMEWRLPDDRQYELSRRMTTLEKRQLDNECFAMDINRRLVKLEQKRKRK